MASSFLPIALHAGALLCSQLLHMPAAHTCCATVGPMLQVKVLNSDNGVIMSGVDFVTVKGVRMDEAKSRCVHAVGLKDGLAMLAQARS